MQTLLNPHPISFLPPSRTSSTTLNPYHKTNTNLKPRTNNINPTTLNKHHPIKAFSADEFPVDEDFIQKFGPKDVETEDEARRRNWVEGGWAPWEEILTPEGDFARKSLNEGEEVELQNPETIEAFKMLRPSYRKKKMEEMGLTEDEFYAKQFEMKGEIPEKLRTMWAGPLVVRQVAPRDWPPVGWEVDRKELEFIREAHKMEVKVGIEDVVNGAKKDVDGLCLDRYKVFLKQYNEWVEANRDRLEEESYKYDQDYFPGRRKRGKDYKEGMYELPFYYPGQICVGKVTTLHLYQGAFVDIGGVHDGWVPIKRNDWYWIRHHIKVGMHVIVEILAKRDPYRFRFPIEMRFVDPNIDHLIFKRFEYPPIFHREEDTNMDELRRDCRRPPVSRDDPGIKVEEEPLICNHPYVNTLWQIHVAEQLIMDDMEINPDKYEGKKLSELTDEEEFDEENSVEYTQDYYKESLLPKRIVNVSVKDLDLEAAFEERQHHNKLKIEAMEKGATSYKIDKLRRNHEMDEYDLVHWRRSVEEREALLRDISCRRAVGLPLDEPGRYHDPTSVAKDRYDPENPLYRYDYWGEPKSSEKTKQDRLRDFHNKGIIGRGMVWYESSYEEAMNNRDETRAKEMMQTEREEQDEDDEVDDIIYEIVSEPQPEVNGVQTNVFSDEYYD
ncbi:nucleic acid-binding, OB-fold-like protein [Artemisia annua]|uniref:Nucleic acid-binding, OB-fold-like protein n=1 Tax=Artemisia annua TaxID=35608 RepID=A0A2U1NNP8_ARTAN|nr:nucleic acid-binding, OB-fold-like protein [Artemisia annua]